MDEAAEKFASAIKESYQALADRSVSAQELNAQLTQNFFNGVINNLRTHAENNRALAEDLIEQQRKQQEASQALTQESVNAYMDFLNSMFSLCQRGTQTAGQAAWEAGPERSTEPGREEGATEADAVRHPLSGWVPPSPDAPITLAKEPEDPVPPEAAPPPTSEERASREAPAPGEERPDRRRAVPASPPTTARKEPPAGEERPERRTP